ncbi:unnamed protein product [Dicrocoelium dendriticum]|nr:unnamed protein product [Dicrocoelium dendriticum]
MCANCNRPICRRCSEAVNEIGGVLCKLCLKETGYRAMRCNWFYDTVVTRFREFGSTAVAKSIFGDKLKHIQHLAEDELVNIISKYGRSESSDGGIVNNQKTSQSVDPLKEAQLTKLRTSLLTLMQNTLEEYKKVDQNTSLTAQQRYWQSGRIGVEFRKEAAVRMRTFCQSLYITTERHRTMQGNSSRHLTQYVMSTLQDEISKIVGHRVQDQADIISTASDDDLDSVVPAEREGVEDRLAQELLDKVLQDRRRGQLPVTASSAQLQQRIPNGNSSTANGIHAIQLAPDDASDVEFGPTATVEHVKVIEGFPTRMEVKVDFHEGHDFKWLYVTQDGTRMPVKFDFHLEHVITATTDHDAKEPFVLSNSGHVGSDTLKTLVETHKRLLALGVPHGVIIEHHLIIWAAKLEDSGRYIAVARTQAAGGMSALTETEFQLEVEQSHRWPMHPLHCPEFVQPLSKQLTTDSEGNSYLELNCAIAGNPTPRCLFYRNNSPVPVVIMPLLTSEQDKTDIFLSSFSRKYTVISSPCRQMVAAMSVGYLRSLTLRINRPGAEDVANYTCRAWNFHGRVETSGRITASDLESNRFEQSNLPDHQNQLKSNVPNAKTGAQRIPEKPGDGRSLQNSQDVKTPVVQNKNHNYAQDKVQSTTGKRTPTVTILYEQPQKGKFVESNALSKWDRPETPSYPRTDRNGNSVIISRPVASPQTQRDKQKLEVINEKPISNELEYSKSANSAQPPSPTSSVFSDTSSIWESPFVRTQSRRVSGPRVVIDRRSKRRSRCGSAASIISMENEIP